MNELVTSNTEYKINRSIIQIELEKNTALNTYVRHYEDTETWKTDCSKVEIYFSQTITNHNGNEMNNEEFEYKILITHEDITSNPNFINDIVVRAEEKFKEYYLDYCKKEIAFLIENMKGYEED